uniref:Ig-like domain-containing protein n=1 Tax=Glossina morsitans morsitans TaxID=37546 RepID=A0A1B0FRK4_GLOMM
MRIQKGKYILLPLNSNSSNSTQASSDEDDEGNTKAEAEFLKRSDKFRAKVSVALRGYKPRRCYHTPCKLGKRLVCCVFAAFMVPWFLFVILNDLSSRRYSLSDWSFDVSRNMTDYVLPYNDTTLLEPRHICQEKMFLLIMLETSEADGVRMLHINNVNLNHSGEVQLSVNQPGKSTTIPTATATTSSTSSSSSFSSSSAVSASTLKVYSSLAVLPRSSNFFDNHSGPTLVETQLTTTTSSSNSNSKGDIIRQPAYVLEGPNDCTALIGGCVRLSVIFEGVPKPQITWFKASRPIVETSNIIINTSARKSVLQISDIAADDSGKYIVQVMNEYGSDVAVASVAVEGPPEPPSGKPSISQGPDRVAIAWCGPPFDGGCMITGFM